jgi:hypothetical protein
VRALLLRLAGLRSAGVRLCLDRSCRTPLTARGKQRTWAHSSR